METENVDFRKAARPILRVCLDCARVSTAQGEPWHPIADLALALIGQSDERKRAAVNAWATLHGYDPSHGFCEDICFPKEMEKIKEWKKSRGFKNENSRI